MRVDVYGGGDTAMAQTSLLRHEVAAIKNNYKDHSTKMAVIVEYSLSLCLPTTTTHNL